MNFSEYFKTKLNAMIYARCMWDTEGNTRDALMLHRTPLISTMTKARYDVCVYKSKCLPYDEVKIPMKDGKPMFVLNEIEHTRIAATEFYFIEIKHSVQALVPNFLFEAYVDAVNFVDGYSKDIRALDVMFKNMDEKNASKMSPVPGELVEGDPPRGVEVDANGNIIKGSMRGGGSAGIAPPINLMAYYRFCLNPKIKLDDLRRDHVSLVSSISNEKYHIFVTEAASKEYKDIDIPIINDKPIAEIPEEIYNKMQGIVFYFLEVYNNARTLVPNVMFKSLGDASGYIDKLKQDVRPLDVMFKKMPADKVAVLGPQPAIDFNASPESVEEEQQQAQTAKAEDEQKIQREKAEEEERIQRAKAEEEERIEREQAERARIENEEQLRREYEERKIEADRQMSEYQAKVEEEAERSKQLAEEQEAKAREVFEQERARRLEEEMLEQERAVQKIKEEQEKIQLEYERRKQEYDEETRLASEKLEQEEKIVAERIEANQAQSVEQVEQQIHEQREYEDAARLKDITEAQAEGVPISDDGVVDEEVVNREAEERERLYEERQQLETARAEARAKIQSEQIAKAKARTESRLREARDSGVEVTQELFNSIKTEELSKAKHDAYQEAESWENQYAPKAADGATYTKEQAKRANAMAEEQLRMHKEKVEHEQQEMLRVKAQAEKLYQQEQEARAKAQITQDTVEQEEAIAREARDRQAAKARFEAERREAQARFEAEQNEAKARFEEKTNASEANTRETARNMAEKENERQNEQLEAMREKIREQFKNASGGAVKRVITPPISMQIYSRFCMDLEGVSKNDLVQYVVAIQSMRDGAKFGLRVIQSRSKVYNNIEIPKANDKPLFNLDRDIYNEMTSLDFSFIEVAFEGKLIVLNKLFMDCDTAIEYIKNYAKDIRELEVSFKRITVDEAKQMEGIPSIVVPGSEKRLVVQAQKEAAKEEAVQEEPIIQREKENVAEEQPQAERVICVETENEEQEEKIVYADTQAANEQMAEEEQEAEINKEQVINLGGNNAVEEETIGQNATMASNAHDVNNEKATGTEKVVENESIHVSKEEPIVEKAYSANRETISENQPKIRQRIVLQTNLTDEEFAEAEKQGKVINQPIYANEVVFQLTPEVLKILEQHSDLFERVKHQTEGRVRFEFDKNTTKKTSSFGASSSHSNKSQNMSKYYGSKPQKETAKNIFGVTDSTLTGEEILFSKKSQKEKTSFFDDNAKNMFDSQKAKSSIFDKKNANNDLANLFVTSKKEKTSELNLEDEGKDMTDLTRLFEGDTKFEAENVGFNDYFGAKNESTNDFKSIMEILGVDEDSQDDIISKLFKA